MTQQNDPLLHLPSSQVVRVRIDELRRELAALEFLAEVAEDVERLRSGTPSKLLLPERTASCK